MTQQPQPWETLPRDSIWRGWWQPPVESIPALPVLAARGQRDGPTVLITGAVHGDEYEGPAAIYALFNQLDLTTLAGRLIGLPVVNVAAWQAHARTTPVDGLDLNRLFPGRADAASEPSRRLAAALFVQFVQPCDVLIDLHSGGARLVHLPMVGWYAGGADAERLARRFGEGLMPWLIPDVPGVLSCEAQRAGKIAIGAEYGGGARLDPGGVAAYTAGLRRVLALLAGADPEPAIPDTRRPIAGSYQTVEQGGLFVARVNLGDHVTPVTVLGRLYDLLGEAVGEVKAERAGIVAALAHRALLEPGDRVAYIG
jgi:predicted deacylase